MQYNLHVHLARLYQRGKEGKDTLQVRPIPELADIPEEEEENLPWFPMLNSGTLIMGPQEKVSSDAYSNADSEGSTVVDGKDNALLLNILCNDDFTFGYIIGKADGYNDTSGNTGNPNSYSFSSILEYLSERGKDTSTFDYGNLTRLWSCSSPDGGVNILADNKTGDLYMLNNSGAGVIIAQDEIYLRAGSPGKGTTKNAFGAISITPSKIQFIGPYFINDCTKTVLGRHGLTIPLCNKSNASFSEDGAAVFIDSTIQG